MSRFSTLLVATVAVATLFVLASPVEAVSLRARLGVPVSVGGMPPAVPSHHPIMVVHRDSDHLLWKPTIEPSSWLGIHLGSPKYQFKSSRRGSTILLTAVNASEIHATHADHLVEEIVNFITLAQLNGLQLVIDVSEAAIVHEEVATRIATDLFPLAQKSNVGFIVLYNPSSKGTLAATQALQKAAGGFTRVQVISVLDYDKQVTQDAAVSSA